MAGPLLIVLHVVANVLWIGSIVSVALVTSSAAAEAEVRGRLAVEIYKRLAVPAFIASFTFGVARLVLDANYYFVQTKFMHLKLFLALIVIALHHVIGAHAKRTAASDERSRRLTMRLAVALSVAAGLAVLVVFLKPF